MKISLIAAVAENYVIGKDGDLPWRLPSDLKWFKAKTIGKTCLMGRLTWESLGFPLPSRRIIVVSSRGVEGIESASSPEEAIELADPSEDQELMILGGSGLYQHFLPRADRFYLTVVHAKPEGDTRFPAIVPSEWKVIESTHVAADEKNPYAHTFLVLDRIQAAQGREGSDELNASDFE